MYTKVNHINHVTLCSAMKDNMVLSSKYTMFYPEWTLSNLLTSCRTSSQGARVTLREWPSPWHSVRP